MKLIKSNLFIIILFAITFAFVNIYTFLTEFSCTDEIWNFQNVYKMYQGDLIYTNNNVIITPLFFIIGNAFFHLLSANLFTFRLYSIAIYSAKFCLIFLVFKNFKVKKFLSILYMCIWIILEFPYMPNGANYNQLAIVFCLIGILHYTFNYSKKSYHLVQGFLIFLIFFTKQTIGIYYAFGLFLFELVNIGFHKKFFFNQCWKLITFVPSTILVFMVMYAKGNLDDFFNLCFGSLLEFGSSNHRFAWSNLKFILLIIFIIAFSIFTLVSKNVATEKKTNIKFLLCLACTLSFNMFPLMNEYHVNMSVLFYYILFLYIIDQLLITEIFTEPSHKRLSIIICSCILLALYLKTIYVYFSNYKDWQYFDKAHPFYNTAISSDNKQKIENMTNYIKSKQENGIDVIVLSYEASGYMVPLSLNHNEFDLAFRGNLGYHGIQKTIEKIANMKNTEFLIFTEEEDCFYQESLEIREYIMNHLEKNGEFLEYSIYINN